MRHHFWIAVALAVAGCVGTDVPPVAAPAGAGATAVTVVRPQRLAVKRVVEQPGAVFAYEEALLVAKLPGYVSKLHADIGQRVRSGDLLAEVDVPETVEEAKEKQAMVRLADAQVEQARKALAAAEANVNAAEASVAEAKAGLGRTQALYDRWGSEAKRVTGLVQGGVIDSQTGDETRNQFLAATASREETRARVLTAESAVRKAAADRDKAAADVTAAGAKRDVARAEARRLEVMVGYTKVRAPFDGVVTRRHVNTGDFLHAGGKHDGVFTLTRLDPVRVVIDVPEADAALVREKVPVKLTVQALGGGELSGAVTRTSWALAPGSRTLRAEIDLPNPDGRLRPGLYVYARVAAELPVTWALPAAAVVKQGEAMVCFRIDGGKAVRTPVRAGRTDGQMTQVLKKQKAGSNEWEDFTGDEVVAAQAGALTDGQAVQVTARP